MTDKAPIKLKPVKWIASAKKDLLALPWEVKRAFGFALDQAQRGKKHEDAKPLKGFGGAGVLEVVEDYQSDTFRCVYTVRFENAVYVLHVFQKKAKKGVATPKPDMDLITQRLKVAEADYIQWSKNNERH